MDADQFDLWLDTLNGAKPIMCQHATHLLMTAKILLIDGGLTAEQKASLNAAVKSLQSAVGAALDLPEYHGKGVSRNG